MFVLTQTNTFGETTELARSEHRSMLEMIILWHVENANHIVMDLEIHTVEA